MDSFFGLMFSANDSKSYGRFASFLALLCLLVWASLIIGRGTQLIPDIPANWLLLVCVPFGISKFGETVAKVKGGPTDGPQTDAQ